MSGHKRFGFSQRRVRSTASVVIAVLLILSISYLGIKTYQDSQAATGGSITLTPGTGTYTTGSTLSITINEDSGTDPTNSVQASLTYDAAKLQYQSITEGGIFPFQSATQTSTPGVFRVARATQDGPVTGLKPIVTVNFKVLASGGTADVAVDKAYSFIANATTNQDILQTVGSASYAVSGGTTAPATKPILTVTPASGSYTVGSTVAATVKLNSYTNPTTTVEAAISYPTNLLQYVSVSEGSAFPTKQRTTATNGVVDIIRAISGGGTPITGDNTIVTINFKVLAAGTAALGIANASAAYDNSGTGTNILDKSKSTGASYTLSSGAVTPTPTPPPPPVTTETPKPNHTSLTSPANAATVSSTGSGGASLTNVDGQVIPKVNGLVSLAPVIENTNSTIKKVEYYLGSKLISSQTKSPFTYKLNTNKLKNGKYVLRVKTTYASGVVDTRTENLLVSNKVNFGYVMRHYGISAAAASGLLVLVGVFLWKLVIPKFGGHGPFGGGHGGFGGDADKHGPGNHPAYAEATVDSELFSNSPSGNLSNGDTAGEPVIIAPQTTGSAAVPAVPGGVIAPQTGGDTTVEPKAPKAADNPSSISRHNIRIG